MVNSGRATTLMSNFALIILGIVTAGALTNDLLAQLVVIIATIVIAVLDSVFPEEIDKMQGVMPLGSLTTLISDFALVIFGLITAGATSDMVFQLIVVGGTILIAFLDAYFPEYVEKFDEGLADIEQEEVA